VARATTNDTERSQAFKKGITRIIILWIVLPLFLLVTGGSLLWWQAWIYCALLLVPMTFFFILKIRHDPSFIERRFKMNEKERTQRRIQAWGVPLFLAVYIVSGLDHRFGWSDPPLPIVIAALILSLLSYLMILGVFLENRWAGRTVETWDDQKVVDTGPYSIVRHPMYTSFIMLLCMTPVALGSWWAILGVIAYLPILFFRIRNEEEVLLRELPEYEDYRSRVRYRIIPFIW
jgi:protein-S-isoprenylcysteine O-methyltransferase Ste14